MFLRRCQSLLGPYSLQPENIVKSGKHGIRCITAAARLTSSKDTTLTDMLRREFVSKDDSKQRLSVGLKGADNDQKVTVGHKTVGFKATSRKRNRNQHKAFGGNKQNNLIRQLAADVVLGETDNSKNEWGAHSTGELKAHLTGELKSHLTGELDDYDEDTNEYSAYLHTHKRGFMLSSSEYSKSCVVNVKETRRQAFNPPNDIANIDTLVEVLVNNAQVSNDVLSAGLKSFTHLPVEKLSKYKNRKLQSLMTRYLSQVAHTLDSDVLVDAMLTMVCLHCIPSRYAANMIHEQCMNHLKSWDLYTMMLVSDCWIYLYQRTLSYHHEMANIAVNDLYYGADLTAQNVVQLLFIISLCKSSPSPGLITKLLNIVRNSLGDITWQEIGIICFALVKIRTPRDERSISFLTVLSKKFIDGLQADQIDLYSITQVMRCLSRCYFYDVPTFDALAASLIPVINEQPNNSELRISHIAMAFAKLRMLHKPLMDSIMHHVETNQRLCRTKDAHLLLQAFGRLDYKPKHSEQFFEYLIGFLNSSHSQVRVFPETFLGSLVALSFLDLYPMELFERAFSPEYLQQCDDFIAKRGSFPICKQLFVLDCSLAIECPDYRGNRLPQHYINMYDEVNHGSAHYTQKMEEQGDSAEVIMLLQRLFGSRDYIRVHPILPHIKTPADIEIHVDSEGNPVIPSSFPIDSSLGPNLTNVAIPYDKLGKLVKETKNQTNAGIHRVAVLVTTPKHYHINSHGLLGVHVMKKRQLRKVGYQIMEIQYFDWNQMNTESEKISYLKGKLKDILNVET